MIFSRTFRAFGQKLRINTPTRHLALSPFSLQLFCNRLELHQRGFQVLDDLLRKHVLVGQVFGVVEGFILQSEDVQVELVASHDFVVAETPSSRRMLQ
jgi:hypothetical protein